MNVKVFCLLVYLILPSFYSEIAVWDGKVRRPRFQSFERVPNEGALNLIGGSPAKPHVYPFQIALDIFKDSDRMFCGGSLISDTWVLTAAHCIDMDPDYILVTLGTYHFPELSPEIVMKSRHYIPHEAWDKSSYENDVGLVELPQKITFNDFIKPVKLAASFDGDEAISIGWGVTETKFQSSVLMEILTTIIPNDQCAKYYKQVIKSTHICTSGEGLTSTCRGDSGGPLLVNGRQVGIVSFGAEDCSTNVPSVYTRVSDFSVWILKQTADGYDINLVAGWILAMFFGFLIRILWEIQ